MLLTCGPAGEWGPTSFTTAFRCGFTPCSGCQRCLLFAALIHFFLSSFLPSFSWTSFPFAFTSWSFDVHEPLLAFGISSFPSVTPCYSSLLTTHLCAFLCPAFRSGYSWHSGLAPCILQKLIVEQDVPGMLRNRTHVWVQVEKGRWATRCKVEKANPNWGAWLFLSASSSAAISAGLWLHSGWLTLWAVWPLHK